MLTLFSVLTACTRTTEPVAPAAPPAAPPEVPAEAALPEVPAEAAPPEVPAEADSISTSSTSPVGSWSSTGCGERTYERRVALLEGGTFSGQERISPCPPGANCMWSGVHSFTGQWTLAEQTVALTVTKTDAQDAQAKAWPDALTWTGGRLLEGDCAYAPMAVEDNGPR